MVTIALGLVHIEHYSQDKDVQSHLNWFLFIGAIPPWLRTDEDVNEKVEFARPFKLKYSNANL